MALGNYRGPSSYKAFAHYALALFERDMREFSYKVYVTDMLRNIPQMTYFNDRWLDAVESRTSKDERSADEIVDDVIASLAGGAA